MLMIRYKMKKTVLFFLCSLFFTGLSSAATDKKVVVKYVGQSAELALCDVKVLTFENGAMSFEMKDGSVRQWNTDEVDCVDFTAAGSVETSAGVLTDTPRICFSGNVLTVFSAVRDVVSLFAADGTLIHELASRGTMVIDMKCYPAGVYFLKVSGRIYKIVNR